MSLGTLIDSQILVAFDKLQDLAVVATFTKAQDSSFDFNSGATSITSTGPTTAKIVPFEVKKPSKNTNTGVKTVIARTKDIGDLNLYYSVNFENTDYRIGNVIKGNGKVWIFEVVPV